MNIKRILTLVLASLLALTLIACNESGNGSTDTTAQNDTTAENTTEEETTEKPKPEIVSKTYAVKDILQNVKVYGRTTVLSTGIACDFSAAGIEFNAYIEGKLTVVVSVSKGVADSRTDDCYFTLYIDGVRSPNRLKADASKDTVLELADFENGGVHNVKLIRQTEARNALAEIKTVGFTGYFEKAPANAKYYIEVLGASNSAGYGNLTDISDANQALKSVYQDATQSYAYMTPQALGADCSLFSVSGIGIVKGFRSYPIGKVFEANSYYRDTESLYKPERRPDLIILAVGSNDETKGTSLADYGAATSDLIMQVRITYGANIPIVWVYYTDNAAYQNAAHTAIRNLGGEASGVYEIQLTFNKLGGNNHPDLASHLEQTAVLTKFIQDKNILK